MQKPQSIHRCDLHIGGTLMHVLALRLAMLCPAQVSQHHQQAADQRQEELKVSQPQTLTAAHRIQDTIELTLSPPTALFPAHCPNIRTHHLRELYISNNRQYTRVFKRPNRDASWSFALYLYTGQKTKIRTNTIQKDNQAKSYQSSEGMPM